MDGEVLRSRNQPNGGDDASPPGDTHRRGSDSNGNGVHGFRLNELERRVGTLEGKVDRINDLCVKIETKLDTLATTAFVWKIFAGTVVLAVATFLGHLMIRILSR